MHKPEDLLPSVLPVFVDVVTIKVNEVNGR